MLHGQSDVVGGDGEEARQLGVCAQVDPVGLQEGPQSAVAHILHDQNVRLCTKQHTVRGWETSALTSVLFLLSL